MKWPPFLASRSPRDRGVILALAALIVGGVAYFFLSSSGGGPAFQPLPTPSPHASVSPTPVSSLPVTSPVFEGKDPFQPLVGPSGGPAPSGTPSPGPTAIPTGGGQAHVVKLLDVFTKSGERVATVEVDGTQYTVHVGDTFATNYRLLSLAGSCGTFVFGDERFTLCVGQEVRK